MFTLLQDTDSQVKAVKQRTAPCLLCVMELGEIQNLLSTNFEKGFSDV